MTVQRLIAAAVFNGNPSASVRKGTRKMPPPSPSATPRAPAAAPAPKMMAARVGVSRFKGSERAWFGFGRFAQEHPPNLMNPLNPLNPLNPKKSARNHCDREV